jgi:hypothetical protein
MEMHGLHRVVQDDALRRIQKGEVLNNRDLPKLKIHDALVVSAVEHSLYSMSNVNKMKDLSTNRDIISVSKVQPVASHILIIHDCFISEIVTSEVHVGISRVPLSIYGLIRSDINAAWQIDG